MPTESPNALPLPDSKLLRLGIFGGTFDPVHFGHLLLAESCREQCRLDQIWLMPAAVPPHKQGKHLSSFRQRLEMLELAVSGHTALRVSDLEIDRGGVSFTVDTLTAIASQYPETEVFLLMGADNLEDLPHWREPRRVCELAIPVAVRRNGSPEPDLNVLRDVVSPQRLQQIEHFQVEMPVIGLSSTEIRQRIARQQSIRYRMPRAVEKYIQTHGLYRPVATGD